VANYEAAALAAAFEGIHAVVHLAARAHQIGERPGPGADEAYRAANVDSAVAAAAAAKAAGCRRFVLVSSVGVHGDASQGRPIDEQSPLLPREPYACSKVEAEQAVSRLLAGSATECVIMRPTLVYGPGCPGNFRLLVRLVDRLPVLPFAALRRRRSLIGIDNLCDALVVAASHPGCAGRAFLVCDGEDVDVGGLVLMIARGLGRTTPRQWAVPERLLRAIARLAGRGAAFDKLAGELRVDGSAFGRVTGWQARVPLAEGVAATARASTAFAAIEQEGTVAT
jgi:nucleoside-diphosphate-sugar epimerase